MNEYLGFYRGKKYSVFADTSYHAQQALALQLKVKKSYEIDIYLVSRNGQPVVHSTAEF